MNTDKIKNWLPIIETARAYNKVKLRFDLMAGLTVALVSLPQCIAYALIAGVEPKHGIYALIIGSILGALFGSSRHLQTGPVNASSIMIAAAMLPYVHQDNYMGMVYLLAFLAGLFQLGAGILRIGNITQFISRSVLVGFMLGAALLIIVNQIPNLLGLANSNGNTFFKLAAVFEHSHKINYVTLIIGLGSLLLVLIINRLIPKSSSGVPYIPSHLLAIFCAAVIVIFLPEDEHILTVGKIPAVLPPLSAPVFDLHTIRLLMASALALALISLSEAIASAKSVASLAGDKIQANQELIGQGLAKMGVAFFSGMPVSGSFTRTSLNYRAGAQTRFASIFSGIFLSVIVVLFSPIVQYIPVAALAGIIMVIAGQMMNWQHIRLAFKTTRSDASVMLATFASTLMFHLDTAIFIGVGLSLILFLRKVQHPRLIELDYDEANGFQERKSSDVRHIPEISIVHLEGDIFFGSADFFEDEIGKIANRSGLKVLILRVKRSCCLDATSMMSLMQFIETMKKSNKLLIISGVTGDVQRVFLRSGIDKVIGKENIFFSDMAVLKSTRQALGRALQYVNSLGEQEYRVRLFYDRPDQARIPTRRKKRHRNT